ncbi:hypothetical protein [Shinella sp. G-2]
MIRELFRELLNLDREDIAAVVAIALFTTVVCLGAGEISELILAARIAR